MQYLITVPAGSTELAARAVSRLRPDAGMAYRDDSALIFSTDQPISDADTVPFAKNVFAVTARTYRRDLPGSVTALARGLPRIRLTRADIERGFRVMLHVDGALMPVERSARLALEQGLSRATGARPTPRGGCQEFWVIGRRSLDEFILGQRLPRRRPPHKLKGALAPELSALIALASDPDPRDVVLDPFAGSGALPLARLGWPLRSLQYNDRDAEHWRPGLPAELTGDRRVRITDEDARELVSVPDGSVSAIITDPPWNEHESVADYAGLVAAVCDVFARVLDPSHGRIVVLVNRRGSDLFTTRLAASGLTTGAPLEILVNGHPATVLVGRAGRP